MKNLYKTLSLISLSLSFGLNAQTVSNKAGGIQLAPQNNAKSAYVNSQEYLSPTSSDGYKSYYGDSLKGFDSNKIKAELLSKGLSGSEAKGHLYMLERDFINKKYNIGQNIQYLPSPFSTPSKGSGNSNMVTGKPIGGGNVVNVLPCVNEDFESTLPGIYTASNAVTGWTVSSRNTAGGSCNPTNWVPGSPEFAIVSTPIFNWNGLGTVMGVIPNSPLGGNNVAQLNFNSTNYSSTRISQQFPVTTANTLFQIAYAGYWEDGGSSSHACCPIANDQPGITIKMFDCVGAPLSCSSLSISPGPGCQSSGVTFTVIPNIASWTQWQVKYIDLTPYVGGCVTIEISTSDCSFGGHYGSTLFDARCGGQVIGQGMGGAGGAIGGPVSFCAGSNQALITAPVGYSTYQWYGPNGAPIAAPQGTLPTLVVNSPIPLSVYTVDLTAPSGCIFTSTNQITTSTVAIAAIGSNSTCPGGASGSATVVGNGSGTGYTYLWTNALTSVIVGTNSIVSNLSPGVYNIVLSGLGAAACGSAASSVTISTAPPGITSLLKPFCGTQAYLGTAGGSNFHWYNGTTPIPAPFGTNMSYTVTTPVHQAVYWLSYLSSQGCQDSLKFTLVASAPGQVIPSPVSMVCPGGTNGTAVLNLATAPGAPPGLTSYSVFSTGSTPAYNSFLYPTSINAYSLTGLAAGSYSYSVFDGSCKYSGTFNVNPYVFNYNVTPATAILCSGNSVAGSVSFANPGMLSQYTYSWSPSVNLFGANTPNMIVTPTVAPGLPIVKTITIVVTPTLINCPIAKTISITVVNPVIPTITAIPALCNTSGQFQILTSPVGGTFATGVTGTNNPISASGGVLTPSLAFLSSNTSTHSLTYSISVFQCVAKNTATYEVSKFYTAALTSTVPPLCVTSPQFNLMNIVQNTAVGNWAGGNVNVPIPNFFNPFGLSTGPYTATYSTVSDPNPNACPDRTVISIPVTNTILPTITPLPEFCTNHTQITMTASPGNGGWLPNINSALSNAGILNPTLVPAPGMTVTYTVSVGPCINTNTTALHVSKFHPAGFSGTINPLCFNSSSVSLMSIVQSTVSGKWLDTTGILNNNFYPSVTLPTGIYVATYITESLPTKTLCPDTRTIAISVLNPVVPVISQVGPFCNNGSPLQLTVSPTDGHWTASPYVSSNGIFSPSLTSVGNNGVQYVVGTNTCNVQQTIFVSIEAFVPSTIVSHVPDLCNTSPILDLSPFTLTSGLWSGTGISGTSFNPNTTGSGSFILKHNTASFPSGLCPSQSSIAVNVFSLATPAVSHLGPFCNSSHPVQIEVSPVGGLFGGADGNTISSGGKFNPAAALIGENVINYSITSGPCVAYAQTIIKVEKFVSAQLSKFVGPFCNSAEAINLNSFAQNPEGYWVQEANETGLIGSMFYPSKALTGKSNHLTYYTHSVPTQDLCPDKKEIIIEVRDSPVVIAVATTQGNCTPVEAHLNPQSLNGEGTWTFGDGSDPVKGGEVTHVYTTPGKYNAQFIYIDEIGCKAKPATTNIVEVHEAPKADFSFPDEIFISEPQIQLTNLSTTLSDNKYSWKVSGVNSPYTDVNPVVTLSKIGKYQVTLIATSVYECKSEVTKTIEVKNNFNVFIPNSFSPNFDGLNDYFIPTFSKEGLDTKSFEMEIFDRWGHSLYHTKDATAKGWDGTVQNKGESVKEEVYIYRVKYKDLEGNAYSKMGHLSLVK